MASSVAFSNARWLATKWVLIKNAAFLLLIELAGFYERGSCI
jgi:hypothetical protein